jgi:hypothetical protein
MVEGRKKGEGFNLEKLVNSTFFGMEIAGGKL